jgi:hypothetical protein
VIRTAFCNIARGTTPESVVKPSLTEVRGGWMTQKGLESVIGVFEGPEIIPGAYCRTDRAPISVDPALGVVGTAIESIFNEPPLSYQMTPPSSMHRPPDMVFTIRETKSSVW